MTIRRMALILAGASLAACGGNSSDSSSASSMSQTSTSSTISSASSSSTSQASSSAISGASSSVTSEATSSTASEASSSTTSQISSSSMPQGSSSSATSLPVSSASSSSAAVSSVAASSSSASSIANNDLPLLEDFDDVVDAQGFFSVGYRSLATSNDPFYYSLSGTPAFAEGRITLAGARFSIGNTQPQVVTTGTDSETFGELGLTQPYRISFCVLHAEVTGINKSLIVYVDNNTTKAGDSLHSSASRLYTVAVDTLAPGQRVAISSSIGTANSFIQVRTESGATVTLDDLWIGYQSDISTEPGAASCSGDEDAPLLPQTNNPVYGELDGYKSWLSKSGSAADRLIADKTRADNMITWQMPHGGFDKNAVSKYDAPWDGSSSRSGWVSNGVELGTIDNDATVSELLFLADVYQRTSDNTYRDAARKALEFLLTMQYDSGGWPQVYPARTGSGSYSNHVTFNDDAMARVLILLDQAEKQLAPLNGDLFSESQRTLIRNAIHMGVQYILNAQILQDGERTVWCAQHDPVTYAPRPARSYELESKSGKESVLVVAFLMTRPQTPAVEAAVRGALAWYRSSSVQVADTAYIKRSSTSTDDTYNPIQPQVGSTMWYRFYDVEQDVGFFSGRLPTDNPPGTGKQYDIMDIEPERRYGYEWGGNYGGKILDYASSVGY